MVLALLTLVGLLSACERKNQYVAPPPSPVTVGQPIQKSVVESLDFTGTTQAVASVDIRARVQGFLEKTHFTEGAVVKQGDLLYTIEPATYQAAVDKAVADLASKKAQLDKSEIDYQRNLRLIKENAASQRDLDNARASRDSAKADVAMAEASLETARINLSYTTIYAPISGRIGRSQVDIGNLVGAGEFTLLNTIKQYDPIYAYFSLNERDLLALITIYRQQGPPPKRWEPPVFLGLSNESGHPHEGKLDFTDLAVDSSTGTILLRGVFPNPPRYSLIPGLFVRIRFPVGVKDQALLVSERALGVDQLGDYVLVVNQDNVVEQRPVKLGTTENGMRVIEDGLKADEWIVVDGIQRARPGAKVNPIRPELTSPKSTP
ncbi:MAG TPA: efflux transporter periplasmic adaptor subunit, partial [Syntrophobacteraceae bacterium]|nr:efflux transporter periplasmic adaptor subunit [Syntrophobacteraceae bacterium]